MSVAETTLRLTLADLLQMRGKLDQQIARVEDLLKEAENGQRC
jgi:hypothetical protein